MTCLSGRHLFMYRGARHFLHLCNEVYFFAIINLNPVWLIYESMNIINSCKKITYAYFFYFAIVLLQVLTLVSQPIKYNRSNVWSSSVCKYAIGTHRRFTEEWRKWPKCYDRQIRRTLYLSQLVKSFVVTELCHLFFTCTLFP